MENLWIHILVFASTILLCELASVPVRLAMVSPYQDEWTWVSSDAYRHLSDRGYNISNINLHQIPYYKLQDLRDVTMLVNQLRDSSVTCVMGPHSTMVAMAAETLQIPYLALSILPVTQGSYSSNYTIAMLPDAILEETLLKDIISYHKWDKIGVLYDVENGMHLIGTLTAVPDLDVKGSYIYDTSDIHQVRQRLIYFRERNYHRIVLLASPDCTGTILNEAMYLSMLTSPFHWVILSMNPHLLKLDNLVDTGVNITMFRLMRAETHRIEARLRMDHGLALDSLMVVHRAAEKLTAGPAKNLGRRLKENMEEVQFMGMTGNVQFDDQLRRKNLSIDILGLNETGFFTKGLWQQDTSLGNERLTLSNSPQPIYRLKWPMEKEVARVVMILEKPFTMLKEDKSGVLTGNDRYEGYAVDLIAELAKILDFKYELYLVPDGKFGGQDSSGEWNGMIKELMIGNATMSVAPIAITVTRSRVVDFTKPFKIRHINVLMRRPLAQQSLLQFTYPLSTRVWILIALAGVIFTVILFILDRFFPENAKDESRDRFSMKESAWFVMASLLQTGTETTPSQLPARILTSSWWFFSLIMVSSYTANLAAFLTMSQIQAPIKSVADLATRNDLPYGTVESSGTFSFFQKSQEETYKSMYSTMVLEGRDTIVRNTDEGIKRAISENYAFIWDSTVTKYIATQNCKVMIIGGAFDPKGYGIGVPKGAQYRDLLSLGILRLDEDGILTGLSRKWWSHGKCGDPASASRDSSTSELHLQNVGGIFIVLLGGVGLALVSGAVVYFWKKRRQPAQSIQSSSMMRSDTVSSTTSSNLASNGRAGLTRKSSLQAYTQAITPF